MHRLNILPLVTYPDANTERTAQNAVAFVHKIGGALHALAINVDIPDVSNALSKYLMNLPQMIREAEATSRQNGLDLFTALTKEASAVGLPLTTGEIASPPALMGEVAAAQARYFDLAVVGWVPKNETGRMIAEAVLFGSGRPVVLLPEVATIGSVDHIAVAWDGSRVAARAIADAHVFLEGASQITIITVVGEKPIDDKDIGERLALSLKARSLSAAAVSIKAEDCPISDTLQNYALEMGADVLVMGGYGHSRVRDFVLGGATEGILNDLKLPALLSH